MRPRLITAENVLPLAGSHLRALASMRPRLITAENVVTLPNGEQQTFQLQ